MLGKLAYPLMWQDELQTALYGQRVLDYGYPKVHGPRNVYYDLRLDMQRGVNESLDAYIGTPWLQYYYAALFEPWARAAADDRARTARLRLPFALAGLGGVALVAMLLARAAGGTRGRRALWVALYCLLLTLSVSLLLHLREVRYYPLVVLGLAASAWLHLGAARAAPRVFGARCLGLAALLVLLFHSFQPAWFAVAAALCLDVWLSRRGGPGGVADFARACAPVWLSALLVLPGVAFYELLGQAGAQTLRLEPQPYSQRLGDTLLFLLRYEFLGPALLALVLRRLVAPGSTPSARASRFLALLVLFYVPVAALLPLFFERYVVALSPFISAIFVLELVALVDALETPARVRATFALALVAALGLASVALRQPELRGRLHELRTPQHGPLDVAIASIRERYPDPSQLVIATSYEAGAYIYYLGSRVQVGNGQARGLPKPGEWPDLVIPRRMWSPEVEALDAILEAGRYAREVLPVADLPTNNLPELWQPRSKWFQHRFELAVPDGDHGRLILYHYRPGER